MEENVDTIILRGERGKGEAWTLMEKNMPPIDGESVASHHFGEEEKEGGKEGGHASFLIPIQVGVNAGRHIKVFPKNNGCPSFHPSFQALSKLRASFLGVQAFPKLSTLLSKLLQALFMRRAFQRCRDGGRKRIHRDRGISDTQHHGKFCMNPDGSKPPTSRPDPISYRAAVPVF